MKVTGSPRLREAEPGAKGAADRAPDSRAAGPATPADPAAGPATPVDAAAGGLQPAETMRIGELAQRAGVTTRTLRYWEEIGLVNPSARRAGGERVFGTDDLDRVVRIRELQDLLGFSLAEIRAVLDTDAVVERLRRAYRKGAGADRRRRLLDEAIAANDRLIARLDDTLASIEAFRRDRVVKGERMRARAAELDARSPAVDGA
ncbi:MAG TPA: MerR family transcriptional regulator [Acidimicrobiales bacterium]|nr:MerR family transcriptional regulator [Acidimicrobiales bacterium]